MTGNLLNIYTWFSTLNIQKGEKNKKTILASEVKYLTAQHSLFCIKKCLTKIPQVTVRRPNFKKQMCVHNYASRIYLKMELFVECVSISVSL